jgi:hypothetical protein
MCEGGSRIFVPFPSALSRIAMRENSLKCSCSLLAFVILVQPKSSWRVNPRPCRSILRLQLISGARSAATMTMA